MRHRIIGVGVLLASLAVRAAPVTESMALAAAQSWLRENPGAAPNMQVTGETHAERAADGSVLWYEVRTSPDGCIVTSPDTRIDPVITVAENWGTGLPASHPLRALLESDMTERLAALRTARPALLTASPARVPSNEVRWRRLTNPPLKATGKASIDFEVNFIPEWREKFLTHWNQGSRQDHACYNLYTPSNYVCGCVATAGACVLQFYNVTRCLDVDTVRNAWVDNRPYACKPIGLPYDWTIMPTSWKSSPALTEEQFDLMGRSAYDMGACLGMNWSKSGSGASEATLAKVLASDFGLASSKWIGKVTVNESDAALPANKVRIGFRRYIHAQNRAGAPVGLAISTATGGGGHSILSVGYGEDTDGFPYARLFMGWAGMSDAWYSLPNASGSYASIDGVVTQIGFDDDVIAICGRVRNASGVPVAYAKVVCDGEKTFRADRNGFWAGRVCANAVHALDCHGVTRNVTVGEFDDDEVDFTLPDDTAAQVRNDADVALDALIAAGDLEESPVSTVSFGGDTAISDDSELSLRVTFKNGASVTLSEGIRWKLSAGTAALLEGRVLKPIAGGGTSVIVMGEVDLRGTTYVVFQTVNVLSGVSVVGLGEIDGPDEIDLYDTGLARFVSVVTFSNGATTDAMPLNWSVKESAGKSATISPLGVLTFGDYDFIGEETVEIAVECNGFSRQKRVRVRDPGGIHEAYGWFDTNVGWRGSRVTFNLLGGRRTRHGVEEPLGPASDGVGYSWIMYLQREDKVWYEHVRGDTPVITVPENLPEGNSNILVSVSVLPASGRYTSGGSIGIKNSTIAILDDGAPERYDGLTLDAGAYGTHAMPNYLAGKPFVLLPSFGDKEGYVAKWLDEDGAKVGPSDLVREGGSRLRLTKEPISYVVRFNRNADDVSGSMSNMAFMYDTAKALPACKYKRSLYRFIGWGRVAEGPVAFADRAEVCNLTNKNAYVDLYAQWAESPIAEQTLAGPERVLVEGTYVPRIKLENGTVLTAFDATEWSVDDPSLASVSDAGVLTPKPGANGTVTLRLSATSGARTFDFERCVRIIDIDRLERCWIEGEGYWAPLSASDTRQFHLVGVAAGEEIDLDEAEWSVEWADADAEGEYGLSSDGTLSMKSSGMNATGALTAQIGTNTVELSLVTCAYGTSLSGSHAPLSNILYPGARVPFACMFTVRASDGTVVSKGGLSTVVLRRLNFKQVVDGKTVNAFPDDQKPYFDGGDVLVVPPDARPVLQDAEIKMEFGVSVSSSSSYTYTTYTFQWLETPPTLQNCLFDPCGGTIYGQSEPVEKPYVRDEAFSSLPSVARLGYAGSGWYTARTGGTKVTATTTVGAAYARLYQRWTEKNCTVTFDPNGGTGERHQQTFAGGEVAHGRLNANVFTREGFVFAGWSTTAETAASAVRLADCAPLGELAATKLSHTVPIDLYAVWLPAAADMVYVPEAGASVPKGWLETRGVKATTDEGWLTAARAQAANGQPLWACYVAGLDTEDPLDGVRVTAISVEDGEVNLEYERRARCVYEEEGCQTLAEGVWRRRKPGDRFFRIRVHK